MPAIPCSVRQETSVGLTDAGPRRAVPITVDGRAGRFLLDSGASKTAVSLSGKAALGLAGDTWTSTATRGVGGGIEWRSDATVQRVELGSVQLTRPLGPVRSVPVLADMQGEMAAYGLEGLLGEDLLASHDVELANHLHTLRLYRTEGCRGPFLSWAAVTVPLEHPYPFQPVIPVTLEGKELRALIDTGSSVSLIKRWVASSKGTPVGGARAASGIGPLPLTIEPRQFGPLAVGRLRLADGPLYVATLPPAGFDVILGMDRLRDLHLWLSYATSEAMLAPE
ncbi:MAG: aspartyl protease family protein [Chloroflexi bacterium]|nr:aspartyl protease family protein [Chloroflexota bacterium]